MSQNYRVGDRVLWNPSNGVSRVFAGQVRIFEQELGVPSGVGEEWADDYEIDVEQLATFAGALLTYSSTSNHRILHALTDGFVSTVLAVAERAGIDVQPAPSDGGRHDVQLGGGSTSATQTEEFRSRAQDLLTYMPY
jgi:hypothetical protein